LSALLFSACNTSEDPVLETGNAITEFKIGSVPGTIDVANHSIAVNLPANHTDFSVTISVSPKATFALKQAEDAEGRSIYRVTAENGAAQDWSVTVTGRSGNPGGENSAKETGNAITEFKIGDVAGEIDEETHSIAVNLPADHTDFSVTISVSPKATFALKQAEDANGRSIYTVTAENGIPQDWSVTVTRPSAGNGGGDPSPAPAPSTGSGAITPGLPADPGITITSTADFWPDGVTSGMPNNQPLIEASDPACDSYRWYVDGEQVKFFYSAEPSPTTYSFQLSGGNYSLGKHVLVLVAVKNGIPYSVEQIFTVSE
jgi:hypothetical protein